ncbi:hypothetical protein TCAL_07985 [Tigriopus californicus]|uniref:Orcokinin n=1 Tax=Tigriopus californicus TaxID=6832 RepID=A0A553N752_TIGCA|nr:uncharacterized protein LOC131884530 isoform X1 [Tigriopus californicus]TRY61230.1 hypothetical protein TCAL_07985 [Tigriopus californicus]
MRSVGSGSWFQVTFILVPCFSAILAQESSKSIKQVPEQSHLLVRTARSLSDADKSWIRNDVEQVVEGVLTHLEHESSKKSPADGGDCDKPGNFDSLNRNRKRSGPANGSLTRNGRTNFDFLNRNGKRSQFDFLNRNGKRSDFDFLNRNGKRSDFDFLNRNGKRSDFDFLNRNGKRSDFDFLNRNGKRPDFDFLNRNGKRSDFDFLNRNGKRSDFDFLNRNGRSLGGNSFDLLARNGKRSDFDFLNRNGRSSWASDLKRSDFDFLNRNGKRDSNFDLLTRNGKRSSSMPIMGEVLSDQDGLDFQEAGLSLMDPSRIDAIINNANA